VLIGFNWHMMSSVRRYESADEPSCSIADRVFRDHTTNC